VRSTDLHRKSLTSRKSEVPFLPSPPASDTWLDIATGIGAILGSAAVGAAGALAFLFGRRASASISVEIHPTPQGFVIATRPRVKAVGIFRVSFGAGKEGVTVRVAEVYVDPEEGDLKEAQWWEGSGFFGQQYVDPGEELTTSVTFAPVNPADTVIGWQVYLKINAPTRFGWFRTAWWADQVFIALPESAGGTGR
jgi:hypothetical protein